MPHAAKIIANGKNNHITLKVDYSGTNQVKHMADTKVIQIWNAIPNLY